MNVDMPPPAELYRNNTFGGTAFSCFGGYQLGFGIYGILVSSGVLSPPAGYIHGMQMFLIIWGKPPQLA